MAVEIGYWSGYYHNSKHPKAPKSIIEKIFNKPKSKLPVGDPDVARFEELEKRRLQWYEGDITNGK